MSKAQAASTSNRKSSSPAAALVRTKSSLSFQLHPKQLVALRSKATEILYGGAAGAAFDARGDDLRVQRDRWPAGLSLSRLCRPRAASSRGGFFHAPATPKENMVESRR